MGLPELPRFGHARRPLELQPRSFAAEPDGPRGQRRRRLANAIPEPSPIGTVLDAWAQSGQWGIRCALRGAEAVLLEEQLGLAQLCRENAELNGGDLSGLWRSLGGCVPLGSSRLRPRGVKPVLRWPVRHHFCRIRACLLVARGTTAFLFDGEWMHEYVRVKIYSVSNQCGLQTQQEGGNGSLYDCDYGTAFDGQRRMPRERLEAA